MATAEALQEVVAYKKRTLLDHICVGSVPLTMAALRAAAASVQRLFKPHPLGWTLHEELLIILMKELLQANDLGVWRALFSIAGGLVELPDQVLTPIRPGSKSMWVALRPELAVRNPRASFNLVFIHGGAFIAGSALQYVATYDSWLKELASRGIACKVLTVHYPLAPENPYPAGRDECEEVIRWLMQESGETDPIIIGADSAGANLAVSSLAHLRDEGKLPAQVLALLLMSPAMDLSSTSCVMQQHPSSINCHYFDYLPREHVAKGLTHYYVAPELLDHPYVSPIYLSSYKGLVQKEIMVISGGAELMAPDIRVLAKKLQAAQESGDIPRTTHYEAAGQIHSWPVLLLPSMEEHEKHLWQFYERVLGL